MHKSPMLLLNNFMSVWNITLRKRVRIPAVSLRPPQKWDDYWNTTPCKPKNLMQSWDHNIILVEMKPHEKAALIPAKIDPIIVCIIQIYRLGSYNPLCWQLEESWHENESFQSCTTGGIYTILKLRCRVNIARGTISKIKFKFVDLKFQNGCFWK